MELCTATTKKKKKDMSNIGLVNLTLYLLLEIGFIEI